MVVVAGGTLLTTYSIRLASSRPTPTKRLASTLLYARTHTSPPGRPVSSVVIRYGGAGCSLLHFSQSLCLSIYLRFLLPRSLPVY